LNVFVDFEQLKEEYEEFRKRLNNYWKERSISCMNEILTQEKSIYLQIAEMIETDILRDILLEEERVPSTNELAKLYAINPATAAKGVNILVDEGVLYKKRGIGMFVSAGAKEAILSRRKNEFYDNYVKKLLEEAASIGLGKEEVIQLIRSGNEV
jgi:DNA-binding transcriptional regulator YhcF (GntR family)